MRLFQHHYASLGEGKETRTVFLKKVLIDGSELTDAFKKRCSVKEPFWEKISQFRDCPTFTKCDFHTA